MVGGEARDGVAHRLALHHRRTGMRQGARHSAAYHQHECREPVGRCFGPLVGSYLATRHAAVVDEEGGPDGAGVAAAASDRVAVPSRSLCMMMTMAVR